MKITKWLIFDQHQCNLNINDYIYFRGQMREKKERKKERQEGFLRCQTPTSPVRLKVKKNRVNNGVCRINSEEWRV